jgi:amino acid adenylation domain-containing protein
VPVDPHGPATRNAYILTDCAMKVAFVEARLLEPLKAELARAGAAGPEIIVVDAVGEGAALRATLAAGRAPTAGTAEVGSDDLAYILYTSGSTGRPKGVMLTHGNGLAYVDWCSEVFQPTSADRFSSHAPFHFDLSILDIYVPLKHGAAVVLVDNETGKDPARLAHLIADQEITAWYSAPSILGLMAQSGALAAHDYSALRLVNFAGEVFPVKHLRSLTRQIPHPAYYNLYGPTETNVCTYHRIPDHVPDERTEPYPIGRTCEQLQSRVVDEGRDVKRGEEGELWIAGPNVMQGYWGLAEQTAKAFVVDESGRWYRTGDIVIEEDDGVFIYHGRRDRMVKKRGFRVELGEIEACLYKFPEVLEAAVVARRVEDGLEVRAFVAARGGGKLSQVALKRFCSENLPLYMVPDRFAFVPALPKTSTDKVDYQRLQEMA